MNKAEFIQTLSGYVPEKLIDTLAESAEWDGLFYEESESKPDKQASDHNLNIVLFMTSDIENRGHRQKVQRTFKEFKAKVKDKVKDFSADNENVSRPSETIEFVSRDNIFPEEVQNQATVDIRKVAEAINNIPPATMNMKDCSRIRNLKLSEFIYIFADKSGGD